jgi:phospholipid/cholesterol/gamma-HCH transport system ATP-binding protein
MSTEKQLLHMQNVHLQFSKKVVLNGLTFTLRPQERLVIMGRSGSGKSTILRLIIGIIKPNAGSIRLAGHELAALKGEKLNELRKKVGMVFQDAALISSLNVRDNLALPLEELTDKTPQEIDQIIEEKLHLVGLSDVKRQLPEELSGGMKKRVGLARALVMNPELILFDEPSSGLDPVNSARIDNLIIGLTEKTKATSIVVTHELDSAFRIATKMAMLYEGKIIEENVPEEFKRSSNPVVSQFLKGDAESSFI